MDKKLVLTSNIYILLYRQSKEKLCTFSLFTLNPDPSAMMLHNILNYRKPEPCPLFNPLLPALHLNKLFKYPFMIFLRYAWSCIFYTYFYIFILLFSRYSNGPPFWRIFNGITQKI